MYGKSPITFGDVVSLFTRHGIFRSAGGVQDTATFPSLCTDSRALSSGCLFVCIRGAAFDGHSAIASVLDAGASAVVVDCIQDASLPHLLVTDTRKALALLASLFYGDLTSQFTLIGITGTNGKTTTAHMLFHLLQACGKKAGMIGTLGYDIASTHYTTANTTPGVIELYTIFEQMLQAGVTHVVMEVSSHALAQQRVFGFHFSCACFTNLTQEHLDYHTSMKEYLAAKTELFYATAAAGGMAVINIDDAAGNQLYNNFPGPRYSISASSGDALISDIALSVSGVRFTLIKDGQPHRFSSPFIGRYNLFNLATALVALEGLGIETFAHLASHVPHIPPVAGRMEAVQNPHNFGIFVDYAHTPDALTNALRCLRPITTGRLICVFGAGGNRDVSKRPLMLHAVLAEADLAIVTTDNPRNEMPESIIHDIVATAQPHEPWWIVTYRAAAIEAAVRFAQPGDCILIAGKGHETYQEIGGVRHHFDDREAAAAAVKSRKPFDDDELALPIDSNFLAKIFNQKLPSTTLLRHVSTDSRNIRSHSLFIPLIGEHFDGHDYLTSVLQDPTVIALCNRDTGFSHPRALQVEDTLIALGALASLYKSRFGLPCVGITGSYGKTTVKEYLAAILEQKASILKTHGNENNRIGVPKTLLHLRPEHRYAVIEMGTNHFGEIAALTHIVRPDIGIITSIGDSHLAFLQNRDGVFREKRALFDAPLQARIFPLDSYFRDIQGTSVGYSSEADYCIRKVAQDENTTFEVKDEKFTIATPFGVNAINATFAMVAAKALGIDVRTIAAGLAMPLDMGNRMRFIHRGQQIWIADCYNANPDSMKASIAFWEKFKPQLPHIAILGDMLELGELTEKYHQNIGTQLKKLMIERVISVGSFSKAYHATVHFDFVEQLLASSVLQELPSPGVILIKASHGIHLEKIIARL